MMDDDTRYDAGQFIARMRNGEKKRIDVVIDLVLGGLHSIILLLLFALASCLLILILM